MGEVLDKLYPLGRSVVGGLSGWPGVGYVLTGGMGPFSRELGLAVDQLQAVAGVWGSGEPFLLRDRDQGTAEWRGLCGAAPFLAVVREVVLATQPLRPLWIRTSRIARAAAGPAHRCSGTIRSQHLAAVELGR